MFNPFTLQGKHIVITGASSGIGRQCAIDCSRSGANISLIGRNLERLEETKNLCEGDNNFSYSFDLNETSNLPLLVEEISKVSGKIDGILHCAGISGVYPLNIAKKEIQEKFFLTNVMSAIEFTRLAVKKKNFSADGGSIIFMASVMGVVGEKAKFIYSMTKGALISGARSLALEYADRKIRFNCISPGVIETPINATQPYLADPELRKKTEFSHPLGLGKTEDISSTVIFLLSDAARWITGQNLIVDGGYTLI